MRLIIIAEESVYEHEVDPSMEVQDVLALLEAETGVPSASIRLNTDSGTSLDAGTKTLESYGLSEETATVFMSTIPQSASSSGFGSASSHSAPPVPSSETDYETARLQMLGNPAALAQIRRSNPGLADAIQAGPEQFKRAYESALAQATAEKQRHTEALNADPYDIEAQKKIEEDIRMERVLENMEHAMEYSPESFGRVTMLYIDTEVNGHPVKAFVDSGAQATIISPECAERCGIMRLLDTRFESVAVGVGTAKILGRIHSAQIKLGSSLHLPCSFTVLEGKGVELLFGLDMLKRYQCSIDLAKNVLRLQSTEIPFLAEHELPDDLLQRQVAQAEAAAKTAGGVPGSPQSPQASFGSSGSAGPSRSGPAQGGQPSFSGAGQRLGGGRIPSVGAGGPQGVPAGASDAARGGKVKEDDIQTLMGLGAERQQAIQLLEASGGNVDYAASMLFGGGAQWP